ncbi:MAG: hypothetical protein O3A51_09650 [Verrucomicrobia bacterium]|nr:hypothetical protein [Verrucomicrobiota bacterium]
MKRFVSKTYWRMAIVTCLALGVAVQVACADDGTTIGAGDGFTPEPAPGTAIATEPMPTPRRGGYEADMESDLIPLAAEAPDTAGFDSTDENLINVSVENETLENVVNMFARISGANIVTTSADLQGTVTVNLRGVKWKPALGSILDVHELSLIEKIPGSGVYSIVPKTPESSAPLVVKSLFLNFTTVAEISPIVRTMMGSVSNATISPFPSRNAIVIRTTEANMAEIVGLVEQMDVPGDQVIVETMFMELTDSASKQLGIRWDSLEQFGMALQAGPLTYGREVNRLAGRNVDGNGQPIVTDELFNNIEYLDESGRLRTSSDVENKLYDVNGDQFARRTFEVFDPTPDDPGNGDTEIIVNEEPTRIRSSESTRNSNLTESRSSRSTQNNTIVDAFTKAIAETQTAVLDFDTFNIVLSALKRTDGVSVVSNPKLIVASGSEDAYFKVGDQEPIIRTEITQGTQDSPGDTIVAELDTSINTGYITDGYLETGIHLKVIPVVKTDDLIEASIEPKLVRRLFPDKVVAGNSWPRIAVKELKTTFTLRSGQTVAIGGLTDTSDDQKTSKVPLLGDIPLIGKYLFSHTANIKSQVETIIFVTLSMADAEGLYEEAGIPSRGELVHGKLIEDRQRREKFEADLEDMRDAAEEESAKRVKERLLKRRR